MGLFFTATEATKNDVTNNDIHDKPKEMLLHIYDCHITYNQKKGAHVYMSKCILVYTQPYNRGAKNACKNHMTDTLRR
jgi:hypothetical protein